MCKSQFLGLNSLPNWSREWALLSGGPGERGTEKHLENGPKRNQHSAEPQLVSEAPMCPLVQSFLLVGAAGEVLQKALTSLLPHAQPHGCHESHHDRRGFLNH